MKINIISFGLKVLKSLFLFGFLFIINKEKKAVGCENISGFFKLFYKHTGIVKFLSTEKQNKTSKPSYSEPWNLKWQKYSTCGLFSNLTHLLLLDIFLVFIKIKKISFDSIH